MIHRWIFQVLLTVTVLLMLWTNLGSGVAPEVRDEIIKTEYQYAAKVTCSLLGTFGDGFLAEGIYRTVINVHNPTDSKITFIKKVVLAEQEGSSPSEFSVTPFKKDTLEPDGAVVIDCFAISNFFCPINGVCIDFTAIDGFLVINSPVELDIVAVYTARPSDGKVTSMDIENVQRRKVGKTIKVGIPTTKPEIKEHIKYPPPTPTKSP
jgi:hypothetical protein